MHLVQIFLPLTDNEGNSFPREIFAQVREELVERFGGLTAYSRAPADGVWKADDERTSRDKIIIYEVMAPALDRGWWSEFRQRLEGTFRQDTVLIRANAIDLL